MRSRRANELPYIPAGPFQIRFPGIHYKLEYVEFIQGIIIGVTALSALPYMTEYLGLPYELAWSCIIIETFLYMMHATLGDPVIPGWVTPSLPLTLVFLTQFDMGAERIQALIALQLLVGVIFLFMGITKLADKFIRNVPTSIKGGILLAAPLTVVQGQLAETGQFSLFPVSVAVGAIMLLVISFSDAYQQKRSQSKLLDLVAKYGNLFPYLVAMTVGILIGELAMPTFELGTIIKIPDFAGIIENVSVFGVGFPPAAMFLKAFPLALVCYIIAFGDFVTSQSLIEEARSERSDEYVDFNSSRSNLISGIRNVFLSIVAPFPPLSGPLWVGMAVSVSIRYKEGKGAMKSLLGAMASFRIGTFLSVILIPIVAFMNPIFPVGAGITLVFQAFVCAKIGMEYCVSGVDKSIAGVMAAVLAVKGPAWGLLTGVVLNLLLSNVDLKSMFDSGKNEESHADSGERAE